MTRDRDVSQAPSPAARYATRPPRRSPALLECEARRIARTVDRYGALQSGQLFDLSGARRWTHGTFALACELAVARGWIRWISLGFYARVHPGEQRPAANPTVPESVDGFRPRRDRPRS